MSSPTARSDPTSHDKDSGSVGGNETASIRENLRLNVPATGDKLPPFGELFVLVYEHLESLRERGHHTEADQLDNSANVVVLIELVNKVRNGTWTRFNAVWSAKAFRTTLYHAIAPRTGGPLWLRQAVGAHLADAMRLTRMSHVWEMIFNEAKDFTNIFVDSADAGHARIIQHISQADILGLKGVWQLGGGSQSLEYLEAKFFPKRLPLQENHLSSSSQTTGMTYKHTLKTFQSLGRDDYVTVFDCLARHMIDRTPLPSFITRTRLSTLVHQAGSWTAQVLHHVMFWYGSHGLLGRMSNDPSCQWLDLLAAGPFALHSSPPSESLIHGNKPPREAARLFVHALFDQLRTDVGRQHVWGDDATVELAHQTREFHHMISDLSESSQQALYRERFTHTGWSNVLNLAKSHIGCRFHGIMDVYNEIPTLTPSPPTFSLCSAIEQWIAAINVEYAPLPFLNSPQAVRDVISEVAVLNAFYLSRRCQMVLDGDQGAAISTQLRDPPGELRHGHQEPSPQVRLLLEETTRILGATGYDPQTPLEDAILSRLFPQLSAPMTTIVNPLTADPEGTTPNDTNDALTGVLARASINDAGPVSDLMEGEEEMDRPTKRRRVGQY